MGGASLKGRVVGVLLAVAGLLLACGGDCSDEIAAAKAFLDDPAHLACQANDDCAIVGTGCHTFDRGVCAQSQLTRAAAESSKWHVISKGLTDCEDSCGQCAVGVSPACVNGFCGGAP